MTAQQAAHNERGTRLATRVFQIGAAGGVGTRLTKMLVDRGDTATGMHRKPEQADALRENGATPVTGDLIEDSVERLAELMHGHDVVVFSAGAHGTGREQTTLIDGEGVVKASEAARQAGVGRFILVSAFPESERGGDLGEGFEHYMRVKKSADVHLAATDLDWVIVRPGLLRDEPGNGNVTAGLAVDYGDVSRDNVAAFIAAAIAEPELRRVIVELTDGTTPSTDAVATLIAQR